MRRHKPTGMLLVAMTMVILAGCNENKRLAEQAQLHAQRQAEQSQQMVALQKELASVQRETQIGRNELGRQRDRLEKRTFRQQICDPIRDFQVKTAADTPERVNIGNIGNFSILLLGM